MEYLRYISTVRNLAGVEAFLLGAGHTGKHSGAAETSWVYTFMGAEGAAVRYNLKEQCPAEA